MRPFVIALVLSALSAGALAAQPIPVVVRVLAEEQPLPNAEVIDRSTGTRALTRSTGEVLVRVPLASELSLRVRQLGFAFQEFTLRANELRGGGRDTLLVHMERTAFAIAPVNTTVATECPRLDPTRAPLALWALAQLREGAERYASFGAAYPFRVRLERRTSVQYPGEARPSVRVARERVDANRWGERYNPRGVVDANPSGFSVPVLSVRALGDPVFWENHCLTSASIEGEPGARQVHVGFVPSASVKYSNWAGTAMLDSATSVLQRLEFQLDVKTRGGPRRLEGYTTFQSPSPLIAIPDSTAAVWWYSRPEIGEPWGPPDIVQLLRVETVQYRRERPPGQ